MRAVIQEGISNVFGKRGSKVVRIRFVLGLLEFGFGSVQFGSVQALELIS